ncbi:MAG: T9SS type A sorting domain-containing protein [Ignavibacteriae bacterium]|nr:T9SS type A sorting domain-containing protein [Ignavibacteriota bacterium]
MSFWNFRQRVRFVLGLFLGGAIVTTAFSQSPVTIEAGRDNTLYEDAAGATSNGAGDNFFVGRTNQAANSIRRGLVWFNLVGSVPANATIGSVTLTLSMSRSNSGDQTLSVHRVLAAWGEGTSNANGNEGGGAPATTNDATWLHRLFNTALWSTPGGSFASTPSASLAVGGVGSYTWGTTATLVSDVQGWLNNPSNNFGWVIIGNEAAGATSKRFDARENAVAANRPKIVVSFSTTSVGGENAPEKFALHQNYPNPFNPATSITFELSARSHASLKIFNLLGQHIATLVDGMYSSGAHIVEWNAAEMPSGVYVYRLEANGSVATRKLVVAK